MTAPDDDFPITPAIIAYNAAMVRQLKAGGTIGDPSPEMIARYAELRADQSARLSRRLSFREREILVLRCLGLELPQIARLLGISPATVKRHAQSIAGKAGTGNGYLLALWAARQGLVR